MLRLLHICFLIFFIQPIYAIESLQLASGNEGQASLLKTSNSQANLCKNLHCVELHAHHKVLIVQTAYSEDFTKIFSEITKAGHTKTIHNNLAAIKRMIEKWQPNLVVLPQQSPSYSDGLMIAEFIQELNLARGQTKTIHLLQYETPDSRLGPFHYFLGLNPRELDLQKRAIHSHVTQLERTNFLAISQELGKLTLEDFKAYTRTKVPKRIFSLEGYQWFDVQNQALKQRSSKKTVQELLPLETRDELVLVAPHPDDVEIGAAGLVLKGFRKRVPTTVINATSGSHSSILAKDAIETLKDNPELYEQVANLHLDAFDEISDPVLKGKIRSHESKRGLNFLNQYTQVVDLNLPFYDHNYEVNKKTDNMMVRKQLAALLAQAKFRKGRFVMAVPYPIDQHICHRTTTKLFVREFLRLSKKHPKQQMILLYYRTPWSGTNNLYAYTDAANATTLQAIVGSERIIGKGGSGRLLFSSGELGAYKAFGMHVESL